MRQSARYDTGLIKFWVLALALLGCEAKEISPIALRQGTLLGEPVFNAPGEVQPIDVPTYTYRVNTGPNAYTVTVRADSLLRLNPKTPRPKDMDGYVRLKLLDAVNNRPVFRWKPTGQKLVAVAIFSNPVFIDNNLIVNSAAAVWRWDSSFPTGKDGEVSYNDGQRMQGVDDTQKPIYVKGNVPAALPAGNLYVWCVWAWDDAGINIRYSSRELPIRVQ